MAAAAISIVIPVLNEAEAFPRLWNELCSTIRADFRVLMIYDSDTDTTLPVAQKIVETGERRLRLIKNTAGTGVVGAILTGFNHVKDGPVLVVMGDLSDDLAKVDAMLDLYHQGFHIVAGSRYMKGGRIENGPVFKQMLSRIAGLSLHWLRGIPTHDATNAFKLYDRDMLRALTIESQGGFELNLEIIVKAFLAGYKIAEIPSVWKERSAGKSNFKLWKWLPHYLKWFFYAFRPREAHPKSKAAPQQSSKAGHS